ncbi:hypothetical protein ACFRMQ_30900 [Kitasatospora sp. NPDC056783]|uniref:hypothetical protein n=1 Tax=Kitasatospora sp. NPDC056783 TaxID=3345943 RepID=UPI0036A76193
MRGTRSAVVTTVAAAVLAGGLTACGGSGDGPSRGATTPGGAATGSGVAASGGAATGQAAERDPKAALAAAAEVMRKAGGARYTLAASDGLEAKPGAGFAHWASRPAVIEYLTDAPDSRIRVRAVGNEAYMGPTDQAAAGVGEQVLWVKMPFLMWRRPFYPQLAMAMDPVNQLTRAQEARLGVVGTETIDGAEVTHYRAVEEAATVLGAIPELTEEHRPHVDAALKKSGETFTLDFWLNAGQELVRYREFGDKEGEGKAVTVTYSSLGTTSAVTAPAEQDLQRSPYLDKFLPPSRAVVGPGPEAV